MYSLHIVESSEISLHGVVVKFDNCLRVSVGILQICSESTVVSFAAHEIGTEFEIQTIAQFLQQNAVYFALVVEFADQEETRCLIR
jgi:hypothetical protein